MFANNSGEWSRDIYLDDSGLIHQIVGMQSWYIRGYQSMPPADKPSCTLSKTNSSSLKNGGWSTAYFRGELLVLGRVPIPGILQVPLGFLLELNVPTPSVLVSNIYWKLVADAWKELQTGVQRVFPSPNRYQNMLSQKFTSVHVHSCTYVNVNLKSLCSIMWTIICYENLKVIAYDFIIPQFKKSKLQGTWLAMLCVSWRKKGWRFRCMP